MTRKEEANRLERLGEEIRDQLHKNHLSINSAEMISKYKEWRYGVETIAEEYYLAEPSYVAEFKGFPKMGNGFELIGTIFPNQYPISKRILKEVVEIKKYDVFMAQTKPKETEMKPVKNQTLGKIFVSHSAIDKKLADSFIKMYTSISTLTISDFVCSSVPGSKLDSGEIWTENIRSNIEVADFVIALVTENFLQSEVSFWELGLAQAFKRKTFYFLKEPLNPENAGDFLNTFHLDSLNNPISLDTLKDYIENIRSFKIDTGAWNQSKSDFIKKL